MDNFSNSKSPAVYQVDGRAFVLFTRFWLTIWAEGINSINSQAKNITQLSERFRMGMLIYKIGKNLPNKIWQTSDIKVLLCNDDGVVKANQKAQYGSCVFQMRFFAQRTENKHSKICNKYFLINIIIDIIKGNSCGKIQLIILLQSRFLISNSLCFILLSLSKASSQDRPLFRRFSHQKSSSSRDYKKMAELLGRHSGNC